MKKFIFFIFLAVPVLIYGVSLNLTVNPVFLLKNYTVTLTMTASPLFDPSNVRLLLYDYSSNSTQTLYNPSVSSNEYVWNYTVTDYSDYRAVGMVITSDGTYLSNVATFTSNIPAASVESTIVSVPFISNYMPSVFSEITNIGSKILTFTAFSSPSGLTISPNAGQIGPDQYETVKITPSGVFLPGNYYTLDAMISTNDPRSGMSEYLLSRFLMGPDGLVVTPVQVSSTSVSVGSNVEFYFSIYHSNDVAISYVYATWITPGQSQTFSLSSSGNDFASTINITSAGTYTLSQIIVGYSYKGQILQMVFSPAIRVSATNSPNSMNIELVNGTNQSIISVSSNSTPSVIVKDGSIIQTIQMIKTGQFWTGTYNYTNLPGIVSVNAEFSNAPSISQAFTKYEINGSTNIYLSDNGWITIPSNAFPSGAIVAVYTGTFSPQNNYVGYSTFNQISDSVSLSSSVTPIASFTYNLYFSSQLVNGLFGNVRVYTKTGQTWTLSPIIPNVGMEIATFSAMGGTYALGMTTQIQPGTSPSILSFYANPSNAVGPHSVQFFLTVNKDCYYKIYVYDMRGRIVGSQSGSVVKIIGNLIYTLDTSSISNGMYVAVVGVGSLPNVFTQSKAISFVVSR
ncbi:hypothetical protein [Athalassotoga saccharophila]|uniref:hypothetical protein n=1 Tax=Athalassotoga saccharophila TaxID=1441386 RepID=UPI00137B385D|nr:hypothetical protein [Athalassotoga saccharophila]BBJ28904.1 hypothetical protein ATHSA_1826 [Athalassotoga saccharophila]